MNCYFITLLIALGEIIQDSEKNAALINSTAFLLPVHPFHGGTLVYIGKYYLCIR